MQGNKTATNGSDTKRQNLVSALLSLSGLLEGILNEDSVFKFVNIRPNIAFDLTMTMKFEEDLRSGATLDGDRNLVNVVLVKEVHQVGRRQVVSEDEHVGDLDLAALELIFYGES